MSNQHTFRACIGTSSSFYTCSRANLWQTLCESPSDENNSDHPHPPPTFAKNAPPKYAIQWGSVWHKSRWKSRDFYRKCGIRTPKIWHTDPPFQESPRQTKPKKGPKRKVHEFRPFLWILVFFLGKTSTIHIEFLFRNAPGKIHELAFLWFGLPGPLLTILCRLNRFIGGGGGLRFVEPWAAEKRQSPQQFPRHAPRNRPRTPS